MYESLRVTQTQTVFVIFCIDINNIFSIQNTRKKIYFQIQNSETQKYVLLVNIIVDKVFKDFYKSVSGVHMKNVTNPVKTFCKTVKND